MSFELDADAMAALFTLPRSDGAFDPDHHRLSARPGAPPSVRSARLPAEMCRHLPAHRSDPCGGRPVGARRARPGRARRHAVPAGVHSLSRRRLSVRPARDACPHAGPAANRHFIEALDLKPAIMLRSVPDMLVSYLDMLDAERRVRTIGSTSPFHRTSLR
ncbi:MAG: hypothetical protein WDM81_18865 [Rhizomicrobium sp.]